MNHIVMQKVKHSLSSLSKGKKEMFELIKEGFENKAIAKKLFISVKTIENHKENIKQKLGLNSVKEIYSQK